MKTASNTGTNADTAIPTALCPLWVTVSISQRARRRINVADANTESGTGVTVMSESGRAPIK